MIGKDKYDRRFAGKTIFITGDHPQAGTECIFVEMVESGLHKSGLLMKVVDKENNKYQLPPKNVFVIEKK